jgi:hypothetical protein
LAQQYRERDTVVSKTAQQRRATLLRATFGGRFSWRGIRSRG